MKGSIVVKPAYAKVPSPAAVEARKKAQLAADIALLKKQAKTPAPSEPNTVYAGVGTTGNVGLDLFFPKVLSVAAGTTVTFVNKSGPAAGHNVAFGDKAFLKQLEKKQDLFPFGPPGSPNQVGPWQIYGSEQPDASGAYVLDGSEPGGVLQTPTFDNVDSPWDFIPVEAPGSVKVTFTKPGVYKYYCEIHGPSMSGEIDVT
jgi:plastocyanin